MKLGEIRDNSCMIPSSAFFVDAAQPAEAAAGIASGGHGPQSTMTGGDLLKAENEPQKHVTLDVGNPRQLMEVAFIADTKKEHVPTIFLPAERTFPLHFKAYLLGITINAYRLHNSGCAIGKEAHP
jgi:hypothetical protein